MLNVINLIKSLKVKRTKPEPYTGAFLDDSTESRESGYNEGFADAQRIFRAQLLKQIRALYPNDAYVLRDLFDGIYTPTGDRLLGETLNDKTRFYRVTGSDQDKTMYRNVFDTVLAEMPSGVDDILNYLNTKHLNPIDNNEFGVVFDAVNGKWSGFPTCCVREYTLRNNTASGMMFRHRDADIETKRFIAALDYCACDACINMRHKVTLRIGSFQFSKLTKTWHYMDVVTEKWYVANKKCT